MMTSHDAIIIGTGAAGGIIAGVLAEAGKDVLLLERGPALSFSQVGRDHLRNQRLSKYGHNAGPELEGNPRVFVDPAGNARTVSPHEPGHPATSSATSTHLPTLCLTCSKPSTSSASLPPTLKMVYVTRGFWTRSSVQRSLVNGRVYPRQFSRT